MIELNVQTIAFLIFALFILGGGLGVVTTRNLIHATLYLILSLFGVAGFFVLLSAPFLAAVQVLVYIGAIAILIIFAVMLTRRVMADESASINSLWWLGALVAAAAFIAMAGLLNSPIWPALPAVSDETINASIQMLGTQLTSPDYYVVPFQIASVLLTVALVGAIAVAGEKK